MSGQLIERRQFGTTSDTISVLGFGGVIVTNVFPETASRYVSEAVEAGVNYFDVGPFYGNAQELLGPALAPYREDCFLACKTRERTAEGAQAEMEESLRLLKTDHFDLYQLHSLQSVEDDVNAVFAPGGAMETIVRARDEGKIRYIGFSAHTEEAALAAMEQFDFDSVLFPINYFAWNSDGFGSSVFEAARSKGMAVLALKTIAYRKWTREEFKSFFRPWHKCWYKPLETIEEIETALRFTLGRPVDAAIPPGHWDLFKLCLKVVTSPSFGSSDAEEVSAALEELARETEPLFARA
jgi:aryl-alcohol dehydrogenase-like predicted oxidoreductase